MNHKKSNVNTSWKGYDIVRFSVVQVSLIFQWVTISLRHFKSDVLEELIPLSLDTMKHLDNNYKVTEIETNDYVYLTTKQSIQWILIFFSHPLS